MRRSRQQERTDRGFAIVIIMVLLGIIIAFTLTMTGYIYSTKKVKYYVQDEQNAINLAEIGISKAIFCLNSEYDAGCDGTWGENYVGETKVVAGHGDYVTTVTGESGERVIESVGTLLNESSRTIVVTLSGDPLSDPALAPAFALQVGASGARLEDKSSITGPVYSGGDFRCDSHYNDITGEISVSETNGLLSRCDITGDAHSDRIWRCDVTGDAYYDVPVFGISQSTVSGTHYTESTTPEDILMPVPDIDFWEASAEYGGLIEGDHIATTGNLGPIHITGDLTVPTSVTVTIQGPIWVDGAVTMEDGSVFQLDPTFDKYGSVILIGDYDNPQPGNQIIVDCEETASSSNVNIVGDLGNILTYDSGNWVSETSPTAEALWSMHMRASVDGWAVGNAGTIIHWDGTSWSSETSPTSNLLGSVSAATNFAAWAVGAAGTIVRWDGFNWQYETSPYPGTALYGVHAYAATDIWAVGAGGIIIHRDGTSWSAVTSPTSNLLRDVTMLSEADGWAVGDSGTILHYNGTDWSSVSSPTSNNLRAVSVASGSDAWAVGDSDTIIRWNGSSWSTETSPVSASFRDVDMRAVDDVTIVGTVGTILNWDGSSLTQQTSPVADDLNSTSGLIGSCANPPNIYGSGHGSSYLMVVSNGSGTGVDTAAVYLQTGVTGGLFLATHGRISHLGDSSVSHMSGEFIYMASTASVVFDANLEHSVFSNSAPGSWRIKAGTWYEKE
ncbi:MAG: hypothetical protein U9Q03_02940 [Patescibacteria group bacterium]|nr:hypothetical protein [Patescibacteria group bacterium]